VIRARGGQFNSVRVDFPADETPTSWYLTRKDKDDIRNGWMGWSNNRGPKVVDAVGKFLDGQPVPEVRFDQ
jgi:hypothetical protein